MSINKHFVLAASAALVLAGLAAAPAAIAAEAMKGDAMHKTHMKHTGTMKSDSMHKSMMKSDDKAMQKTDAPAQ